MRIGLFLDLSRASSIDDVVASARQAADDGFASVWVPHIFSFDALTTLAVIARDVPGIELGTAVVPTYPRHPMALAQQALTVQAVSGGRLALGIGLSHQLVIEGMFGMSFERPARHMREYLSVLLPLVREGQVSFKGETLAAEGSLAVGGATPFPVLLAALAPRMLELAGSTADGTITWVTGRSTLRTHIVPTITGAAERAGRAGTRIVAALPVCVTDDEAAARERAARVFSVYGQLPSYRAVLDREGAEGPQDVVVAGDEAAVRAQLEDVAEIGATDFVAVEYGRAGEERDRTRALLKTML